jgi:hypothetical protein
MTIALSYREFSTPSKPTLFQRAAATLKPLKGETLASFPKCTDRDTPAWNLGKKKLKRKEDTLLKIVTDIYNSDSPVHIKVRVQR